MAGTYGLVTGAWMDRMLAFWSPGWTLGGCAVAVAVALAARHRLARAAHMPAQMAGIYLAALGMALAVTLSPRSPNDTYFVFGVSPRGCDVWPRDVDLWALVSSAQWQFNVLLFVPVGAACRFARHGRWRLALAGLALLTPVVIEASQYAALALHRVCQGADVLTNWLGLVLGYTGVRVLSAVHHGIRTDRVVDEPLRDRTGAGRP